MLSRRAAKESVGLYETWKLGGRTFDGTIDIAGWSFKCTFERYAADAQAFTLEMAAGPEDEGFRIFDPEARLITCRILPATLQTISDTTGNFDLYGDLLATPLVGTRFAVADLQLTVVRGATT